jgi:hypothetical protein
MPSAKGNAMQWNDYLVHGNVAMARGSVLRIEDGRDVLIHVANGELWLTQEADGRDRCLAAGAWFRLERNGVAIAQSLEHTVVSLCAPERELYARRITVGKAGSPIVTELYGAQAARASRGGRLRRMWASLYTPHARPTTAGL